MKFEFYKHIENENELKTVMQLFEENEIEIEVSSPETILDSTIVGTGLFAKYTIKLLPKDFNKANQIYREYVQNQGLAISDYPHLESMSNEELLSILINPNDWSVESEIIARKILVKRDANIPDDEIELIKQNSLKNLHNGKSVSLATQILVFLAILVGVYLNTAFLIAGLGMGYYYSYGTATDKTGVKYNVFDNKSRKIGKYIFYCGIIGLIIQVLLVYFKIK